MSSLLELVMNASSSSDRKLFLDSNAPFRARAFSTVKVVAWEHGLFFSILVILSVQLELPFLHMKNLDSIDSLGFFLQSVC